MRNEKKMWEYLKPKLAPFGKFDRIETGATTLGVPDVDGFIKGHGPVRIELKICNSIKKGLILRPSQHRWMQDRIEVGDNNVFILAVVVKSSPLWLLIKGKHSKELVSNRSVEKWEELSFFKHEGNLDFPAMSSLIAGIT